MHARSSFSLDLQEFTSFDYEAGPQEARVSYEQNRSFKPPDNWRRDVDCPSGSKR